MTTRENLIPDDQPYGERQAQKERMQMAGLPIEAAGSEVEELSRRIPASLQFMGNNTGGRRFPASLEYMGGRAAEWADIFEEIEPTLPPGTPYTGIAMSPKEQVLLQMEASPNPIAREIARRVREGR